MELTFVEFWGFISVWLGLQIILEATGIVFVLEDTKMFKPLLSFWRLSFEISFVLESSLDWLESDLSFVGWLSVNSDFFLGFNFEEFVLFRISEEFILNQINIF